MDHLDNHNLDILDSATNSQRYFVNIGVAREVFWREKYSNPSSAAILKKYFKGDLSDIGYMMHYLFFNEPGQYEL